MRRAPPPVSADAARRPRLRGAPWPGAAARRARAATPQVRPSAAGVGDRLGHRGLHARIAGAPHHGRAHGGHRLAGLPAVLREQQADQRQGLRERGRLRGRGQARLQRQRRSSGPGAVRLLLRAGAQELSTSTSTRSRSPRRAPQVVDFSTPYYTNPQAIIVATARRSPTPPRWPALRNATIGVQIGTTSLQAVNALIKPTQPAAGVQHLQRRRERVQDPPRRRASSPTCHGVHTHLTSAPAHDDRRSVQRPGRRQLGPAAQQGLDADLVRRQGGQRAAEPTARSPRSASAGSPRRPAYPSCTDASRSRPRASQ